MLRTDGQTHTQSELESEVLWQKSQNLRESEPGHLIIYLLLGVQIQIQYFANTEFCCYSQQAREFEKKIIE